MSIRRFMLIVAFGWTPTGSWRDIRPPDVSPARWVGMMRWWKARDNEGCFEMDEETFNTLMGID